MQERKEREEERVRTKGDVIRRTEIQDEVSSYSFMRLMRDRMALELLESCLTGWSQLYRSDIVGLEFSTETNTRYSN